MLPDTLTPPTASLLSLQALTQSDMKQVNALILSHMQSDVALIGQVAQHIIASGGKRLRPALTLASARLCGYSGKRHLALASCVEFIHTATLLHDDVVDDSKLRRGAATANDVWGNKTSVLVGDFLLSRAFQLMVADGSLEVLRILSDASAVIAQGEVLQLMTEGDPETSREDYLEVISSKTATLFAAACELGGVLVENALWQRALRDYGQALGMAFQLTDDALDYTAKEVAFGKTVGDDFRDGKITLPVIHAYQKGTSDEANFWKRTLHDHSQTESDLEQALNIIDKYDGIGETLNLARDYCEDARMALADFPHSNEKAALLEAVDFCLSRTY